MTQTEIAQPVMHTDDEVREAVISYLAMREAEGATRYVDWMPAEAKRELDYETASFCTYSDPRAEASCPVGGAFKVLEPDLFTALFEFEWSNSKDGKEDPCMLGVRQLFAFDSMLELKESDHRYGALARFTASQQALLFHLQSRNDNGAHIDELVEMVDLYLPAAA